MKRFTVVVTQSEERACTCRTSAVESPSGYWCQHEAVDAALRAAFASGAEAMRDRASQGVRVISGDGATKANAALTIEALPLPEYRDHA